MQQKYDTNTGDVANQGLPFMNVCCNVSFTNAIKYCHGASLYKLSIFGIPITSNLCVDQVTPKLAFYLELCPFVGGCGAEASRGRMGRPGDRLQQ